MYKLDLYIDGQQADLFGDESVEMMLTTQNVNDLGAVYGDYSRSFTLPASPRNNSIFKHYYNVDISGGFTAALRTDAVIEVNKNLFREGSLELTSVQMQKDEPYAYTVSFYTSTTSLKDLFGEDQLTDLDLSAQDHSYNDTNIEAGIDGYVAGTDNAIIYPMITPVTRWFFNSQTGNHDTGNIHYTNNTDHGVYYYDFKPAIKLTKVIDAIEAKYNIEFESGLFDSIDFGNLFMWCHRRAGYMFKDQAVGPTSELIELISGDAAFDSTLHRFPVTATSNPALIAYSPSTTASTNYRVDVFINDERFSYKEHTGSATNVFVVLPPLSVGDYVELRLAPAGDGAPVTVGMIANWYADTSAVTLLAATAITLAMTTAGIVTIAEQMPEQKIVDFIGSLIRAYNLVVVRSAKNKYKIEPLDVWYYEGATHEITKHIDTTDLTINRPELYRRISFEYNETKAILGEEYRLQNDVGYGDLKADFSFDGGELDVQVGFDNMLFERLSDQYSSGVGLTDLNVGQSITREGKPYIGLPFIFYVNDVITVGSSFHWEYIDQTTSANQKFDMWLIGNINANEAELVTKTLNFGTEVDPYLLQAFSQGLYDTYWKTYITNLYSQSRRLFQYTAQLPLGLMLTLNNNDKLTINSRNYIINSIKLDLNTGAATLELLNHMGDVDPALFSEILTEQGEYIITEALEYIIEE